MSGSIDDCFPFRRVPVAICLCLLAFLFAVEAKTAWYGPKAGPGSDVRAAKALPSNAPRAVDHGVPALDPVRPQAASGVISAQSFAEPWAVRPLNRRQVFGLHPAVFKAAFFSPQLFFRPPPVA